MTKHCIKLDSYELVSYGAKPLGSTKCFGTWKWMSVLAILICATVAANASEPKRILLLHSYGRDFSPWKEYANEIRAELDRKFHGPIDIYEASLASARFADGNLDEPFVEYLHSLFDKRKLDLVVAIGGPAAVFFEKNRLQISSTTPVVLMGLDQRVLPPNRSSNETAVTSTIDLAGVVENYSTCCLKRTILL
jgi:hypothetical protein